MEISAATPSKDFVMVDSKVAEGGASLLSSKVTIRGVRNPHAYKEEIRAALDKAAKKSGYSCKIISWEDAQRGTDHGTLSCWGGNISDVWLEGKNGEKYYTFRPDNWNERLCTVETRNFAIVVNTGGVLTTMTLKDYLSKIGELAHPKEGIPADTSINVDVATIRYQYCVVNNGDELTPNIFNYQTTSDNPNNLNIMCNTQGVAVGSGNGRICLHCPNASGGLDDTYIQVDATSMAAGADQEESAADTAAMAASGKATVSTFGTPEMKKSCNAVATIQLPIQQKKNLKVPKGLPPSIQQKKNLKVPKGLPPCPSEFYEDDEYDEHQPPVYRSFSAGSLACRPRQYWVIGWGTPRAPV